MQWRLKHKLSGGGPLPDVGIYSINAARFLTGEEPVEVLGQTWQPEDDPRFAEVEASVQFTMRFPGGFSASCSTSYASHRSQMLRLHGSDAWVELNPAFAYEGLRLRTSKLVDDANRLMEAAIPTKNQFTLELDHMAECVLLDRVPHTRGEEGLQDMRIIEGIYESARKGRPVKLDLPGETRGPEPAS
jgi:predicted dehydrogenase